MNTPAAPSPAATNPIFRLWRQRTMATVWRHPSDWHHPAVDAMVETLDSGVDPLAAAERLGAARASNGAGITETIDDLTCLYQVIGTEPPLDVVRAVSSGWATGRESSLEPVACVEPVSGLNTVKYLFVRLKETYNNGARTKLPVTSTHCLLILDVALDSANPLDRFKRSAHVGDALRDTFGAGHPMANLTNDLFAVLLERDQHLGENIRRVHDSLPDSPDSAELALRQPPRVWVVPLPTKPEDCLKVLTDLRR